MEQVTPKGEGKREEVDGGKRSERKALSSQVLDHTRRRHREKKDC